MQLQQSQFPYITGFADIGNPELTLANGTFVFNVLERHDEHRVPRRLGGRGVEQRSSSRVGSRWR